ncbi:MAG TPA: hypothetical protein VLH79_13500 [Chthonomonadales bacterium]|nr:hypothetical protein [Chthonomonadales bacterium]
MGVRGGITTWRACFVLTLALAAAVYGPSLDGGLVWDDPALVSGEAIGGGKRLRDCFTEPFFGVYFRPLVSVSFFIDRRLFGENPAGYRLVNVALHVGATALIIGFALAALRRRSAALVAGLLFAVQPAQVGAVAWIGGRTDALAVLWAAGWACMLASALRLDRQGATGPGSAAGEWRIGALHVGALLCYTAMLFTKEQMAAALPLVPLAWHAFRPPGRRSLSEAALATLPYAAVTAFFAAMAVFIARPPTMEPPLHLPGPVVLMAHSVAYYGLLLAAPTPKWMHTLSEGWTLGAPVAWAAFGLAVAGASALLWVHWLRRWPEGAWLLAFIALALLPVLNLVALPYVLVAPYRAACAGLAYSVLAAGLLTGLRGLGRARFAVPRSLRRMAWVGIVTVVVVWFGALTAWGASRWRSEESWFSEVRRHDPVSVVARYMLARDRYARSDVAGGLGPLVEVLEYLLGPGVWRSPEQAVAAMSDPVIVSRIQRSRGFAEDPRAFPTKVLTVVGWARLQQGEWGAAEEAYRTALALSPGDADARAGLEAAVARIAPP